MQFVLPTTHSCTLHYILHTECATATVAGSTNFIENDLTVNNQIPTYENIYQGDTSKLELTTKILMKKFNLLHQVHSPEQIAQASAATNVTTSTLVELEL